MGIEALLLSQVITISGSTGQVVTKQADGSLALENAASSGVGGSTGATDNAILRADGAGGATLQNSGVTIDDSGNVAGVAGLTASGELNVNGSFIKTAASPFGGAILLQIGNDTRDILLGNRIDGRVQINNGGNISNPVRALNVYGDNTTTKQIRFGNSNSFFWEIGRDNAVTGNLGLSTNNGSDVLVITPSGEATFASNLAASGTVSVGTYTVATLPSAAANAGRFAQVTDSNSTTNGNTVAGGGANRVPVFSNGTNWIIK